MKSDRKRDTWTHLDVMMAIGRWISNDHAIKAHDREIMAYDREIVAHDRYIKEMRGRLSLYKIVDRVVGQDPCGFASSDGVDFIAEWTAHIAAKFLL